MSELSFVFIPALGAFCWAAGGTTGFSKVLRRYFYPVAAGLLLGIFGAQWWSALLFSISSMAVFSLGYGDGKSWLWRGVVGSLYGASLIPLGPTGFLAPFILLVVFTGQMALSMKWNKWTWKIVETTTGFTHGLLACAVSHIGGW